MRLVGYLKRKKKKEVGYKLNRNYVEEKESGQHATNHT